MVWGWSAVLDPGQGRGYISAMPPRRSSKKDSPAKLAGRMKRRWRVVLLRAKGEILGTVEAPDVASAKAAAAVHLVWTKSSATGSWCRSSPSAERAGCKPGGSGEGEFKWLGCDQYSYGRLVRHKHMRWIQPTPQA